MTSANPNAGFDKFMSELSTQIPELVSLTEAMIQLMKAAYGQGGVDALESFARDARQRGLMHSEVGLDEVEKMTNEETLAYIDEKFDILRGLAIKGGQLSPGMYAVMKMTFIAGMSAALHYDGEDITLGIMVKKAMENISERYGGRTIFPITPLEDCQQTTPRPEKQR